MTTTQNFGKVATAIGLFASCIKSGERWTEECETASKEAHIALLTIGTALDRLTAENEKLRATLEPFAEVARWAKRNNYDLEKDFDMILRGPASGHLQAQSHDFVAALVALEQIRK